MEESRISNDARLKTGIEDGLLEYHTDYTSFLIRMPYIKDRYWWLGNESLGYSAVGMDGVTPHIDATGNWFVGELDTGVKAKGDKGEQGIQG